MPLSGRSRPPEHQPGSASNGNRALAATTYWGYLSQVDTPLVDFVSHPLGVDLRSAFITFKPLWILMMKPIRRFASQGQNGNVGSDRLAAHPTWFRYAISMKSRST